MEGIIVKALSGFYYVRSDSQTFSCRARGKLRKLGQTPLVGDRVCFSASDDHSGTVTEILPRKNTVCRPTVANIDMMVMIASAVIPVTDPLLIDRVSVMCERVGCEFLIILNKCDLDTADDLFSIYEKTPYPCLRVSAKTGLGIDVLYQMIQGKICCFTGNSGVGKSSILNALDPKISAETADVSYKLGRGKHTTRHIEFYDIGEHTYIADTPGFSSLDELSENPIRKNELSLFFPEFYSFSESCRFLDCSHRNEPGCDVRKAVNENRIHPSRYNSYKLLYNEASKIKEWELK